VKHCIGVAANQCPVPHLRCHQGCGFATDDGEPDYIEFDSEHQRILPHEEVALMFPGIRREDYKAVIYDDRLPADQVILIPILPLKYVSVNFTVSP
jgi:hypothetical protein